MSKKILIVDDERNIRTTLKMCLSGEGYEMDEKKQKKINMI